MLTTKTPYSEEFFVRAKEKEYINMLNFIKRQSDDILRVSRPSPIKILNNGKFPYRKVGAHRYRRVNVMKSVIAPRTLRRNRL
jgi:hypothetical protein